MTVKVKDTETGAVVERDERLVVQMQRLQPGRFIPYKEEKKKDEKKKPSKSAKSAD